MVTKDIHHEAIEQLDVVLHVFFVGPVPPNVDDVEVVQQHEEVNQDPRTAFCREGQDYEEQPD